MVEIRRLRAGYGRATVLFDLDLVLNAGEVTVLLGRNGAGKSTTLKSVMGLVQPTSGEIVFEGKRIDSLAPYRIARLGLGYVPEERRIFTDPTVDQNLEGGHRPKAPGLGGLPWQQNLAFAPKVRDPPFVIEAGQVPYGGTLAGLEADST